MVQGEAVRYRRHGAGSWEAQAGAVGLGTAAPIAPAPATAVLLPLAQRHTAAQPGPANRPHSSPDNHDFLGALQDACDCAVALPAVAQHHPAAPGQAAECGLGTAAGAGRRCSLHVEWPSTGSSNRAVCPSAERLQACKVTAAYTRRPPAATLPPAAHPPPSLPLYCTVPPT